MLADVHRRADRADRPGDRSSSRTTACHAVPEDPDLPVQAGLRVRPARSGRTSSSRRTPTSSARTSPTSRTSSTPTRRRTRTSSPRAARRTPRRARRCGTTSPRSSSSTRSPPRSTKGYAPYDVGGHDRTQDAPQDALQFLNEYKALTLNHHDYTYAQEELGERPRPPTTWGTTTTLQDAVTDFSMESVMAKDARQCIKTPANPTAHWETKQEWIDSLTTTYWSQVIWHEFGHSQGLTHNFMGSVDKNNFPVQLDTDGTPVLDSNGNPKYKLYSSSVMEYNAAARPRLLGRGLGAVRLGRSDLDLRETTARRRRLARNDARHLSGQIVRHRTLERPGRLPRGRDRDPVPRLQRVPHEVHAALPPGRPRHHAERDHGERPRQLRVAVPVEKLPPVPQGLGRLELRRPADELRHGGAPVPVALELRHELRGADVSSSSASASPRRRTHPRRSSTTSAHEQVQQRDVGRSRASMAAFHEAIIQQSSGQRPYVTQFDNYFGDVTLQGITLDKLDALQSFTALWPVDNYDPTQAAGAYISSFSPYRADHQRRRRARRSARSTRRWLSRRSRR